MSRTLSEQTDRFVRQQELIPRERLAATRATVVGVGAIGRQLAIQLAAIGTPHIQLIDFDNVEPSNVATQGYFQCDIGLPKVQATAHLIRQIDSTISVEVSTDRYRPGNDVGTAVFCCVDRIEARAAIWRSVKERCQFWCDGRMMGEVLRVLTSAHPSVDQGYQTTLFPQSQAQQGSCTSRSTIYCANIAAGWMIHQFARWLRGVSVDRDLSVNLLASELASAN